MFKHSLIALAAMGAGLIGFSATEASAVTLSPQKPVVAAAADNSLLVEVKKHRNRYWDRRKHGNRHHRRSNRYRHYYGGYYYENPWWLLPMLGAGIVLNQRNYGSYGSNHVEWCLNRYRSYNVRTNTWRSYSGHVRQCVSPYGP
jgi:preprotein translocase subunit Sec61beta